MSLKTAAQETRGRAEIINLQEDIKIHSFMISSFICLLSQYYVVCK